MTTIKCKCGADLGEAEQDFLAGSAFSVASGVIICNACGASRCWHAANCADPLVERTRRLLEALGVDASAEELERERGDVGKIK